MAELSLSVVLFMAKVDTEKAVQTSKTLGLMLEFVRSDQYASTSLLRDVFLYRRTRHVRNKRLLDRTTRAID